jgi:hypothetical protein
MTLSALNSADFSKNALYYEYSTAADPAGLGLTSPIPIDVFPQSLHQTGPTRIIPLDISAKLNCPYPAT